MNLINSIRREEKTRILFIGIVALVVRCIYWLAAPPANASDSWQFLLAAKNILQGNFSFLFEYPFHALYSILLVPRYLLPYGLRWYIPFLHISLSVLSVVLLYLISRRITSDWRVQVLTGLVAIFYPYLLFWLPYVLTETAFFFFLLLFVYLLIIALRNPAVKTITLLGVAALLLLFSRPVSLGILGVSAVIYMAVLMKRRFPRRWVMITGALVIGGLVVLFAILSLPSVSQRVLRIPSISQSLWLSTHIVAGTAEEWDLYTYLPPDVSMTIEDVWMYKSDFALNFIRTQPLEYLWMAARRFVNYWYPWLHLAQWSLRHRAFDALLSLGLTLMVIVGLRAAEDKKIATLMVGMALTLGLVTALSQIDSDGRYRLPAEILLIPVASIGVIYCVQRLARIFRYRNMIESGPDLKQDDLPRI